MLSGVEVPVAEIPKTTVTEALEVPVTEALAVTEALEVPVTEVLAVTEALEVTEVLKPRSLRLSK